MGSAAVGGKQALLGVLVTLLFWKTSIEFTSLRRNTFQSQRGCSDPPACLGPWMQRTTGLV